jgi:hypothetical protein
MFSAKSSIKFGKLFLIKRKPELRIDVLYLLLHPEIHRLLYVFLKISGNLTLKCFAAEGEGNSTRQQLSLSFSV